MKVYIDSPVRVPYIIVESPLPSGAGIVENHKSEELEVETGGTAIEGDWGEPWWTHQDVLDDPIVFFGTGKCLPANQILRFSEWNCRGAMQLNPVTFEGMYTKGVRG